MYNLELIYRNPIGYDDFLSIPGPLIYRIFNAVTNKSYIGKTNVDLNQRLFTPMFGHFTNYEDGSGAHLYNSMRKYGLHKFFIEILSINPNDTEEYFINKYDTFHNGYNNSKTGLPFNEGSAVEGKIYVNKDGSAIYIKPDELDYYLSLGYSRGRGFSATEGYIRITHPITGHSTSIPPDRLAEYKDQGYVEGLNWETNTGRIAVNNGEEYILIDPNYLSHYESLGYKLGRGYCATEGLIWITDGVNTTRIKPEDMNKYPGYYEGIGFHPNLGNVWMHKGSELVRIPEDEVESYKSKGYELGQGRLMVVNKDNECHRAHVSELKYYIDKGYQKGRYWYCSTPFQDLPEFNYLFNNSSDQ